MPPDSASRANGAALLALKPLTPWLWRAAILAAVSLIAASSAVNWLLHGRGLWLVCTAVVAQLIIFFAQRKKFTRYPYLPDEYFGWTAAFIGLSVHFSSTPGLFGPYVARVFEMLFTLAIYYVLGRRYWGPFTRKMQRGTARAFHLPSDE